MKKAILLSLIMFILTSCQFVNFNKFDIFNSRTEKELIINNDFESQLQLKYLTYSDLLYEKKITKDARYFRIKGKQSNIVNEKDEKLLDIEFKSKFNFSENTKFELLDYKNRLIQLVQQHNLKQVYSIKTAELYFTFNCWNYYTFVNQNVNQALYCKTEFIESFLKIEREFSENSYLFNKQDNDELMQLTPEERAKWNSFNNKNYTTIYFDFDKFKLNQKALTDIKIFLKYLASIKEDYRINIYGNTDRSGNVFYNNSLGKKRAMSVYNVLVKNGVPSQYIVLKNNSSVQPSVITKNKTKSDLNRRVEIEIIPATNEYDYIPQPTK